MLGQNHPETASSLNNLAMLLDRLGDLGEARPLFERALRIDEKVLGPDHPDTALRLTNLGTLLRKQGSYAEARPLLERAVRIREKVLEPGHPEMAIGLLDLSLDLSDLGMAADAREVARRAYDLFSVRSAGALLTAADWERHAWTSERMSIVDRKSVV